MAFEIPNYFMADLGPEAEFTTQMVTEACLTLRRNGEHYLKTRDTAAIIRVLSLTAENWLEDDYPFRKIALGRGPLETGFAREVLQAGLDHFFGQLTGENLEDLLLQELGHLKRLDRPCAARCEAGANKESLATGPDLITHYAAGNVPVPAMMSMVLGLLVRSSQFVKCARGASFIPRLFAHSLYTTDAKLGSCLEIAEWKGGKEKHLEDVLHQHSECVTATGSDETLDAIRHRLPGRTRFLGYGHQVSFGYVTLEAMGGHQVKRLVRAAADDVIAWDQLGCLSPHVFYVENDGREQALRFAELLADELEKREKAVPRGEVSKRAAAEIASRRSMYEVRSAHMPDTVRHWCSEGNTDWTVVYENDPLFQLSCLNRFIYVKATPTLDDAFKGAEMVREHVSTVGLACAEDEKEELARRLARWGATRICPIGRMQKPPLTWRHDGRPLLGDLVRWTDWEL
ncbi:MAG: hypothetical protein ISQ14_09980 [Verrucomicrobiae bacterium]|nr:hypothetical protein [Verrucomicrobiae bacterium]